MESESDSDASHISSTPPRIPNPPPLSKPKSKPRSKSKPKSKPKPSIPNPSPPPPPPPPPPSHPLFPLPDLSTLHGLPVKRLRTQPDPSTSNPSSFSSLFKSRHPNSTFSHFQTPEKPPSINPNIELEKIESFQPKPKKPYPNFTDSTDTGIELEKIETFQPKPQKSRPNFIVCSSNLPPEQPKRLRYSSEGNFVRLNVNGYGRKRSFRNGSRKYPSKFKRYRRKFVRGVKWKVVLFGMRMGAVVAVVVRSWRVEEWMRRWRRL